MCCIRIFKLKSNLKKFAKMNQLDKAMEYITNIELTVKEKRKLKKIIPCLFNDEQSHALLLVLDVN